MQDVLQDKVEIGDGHLGALREVLSLIESIDITWALSGSMAFALRNIPYSPNDIDIRTNEAGAHTIQNALLHYMTEPVSKRFDSELVSSHLGKFNINGIEIEVMGDLQLKSNGSWDSPEKIDRWIYNIPFEETDIPVLSLDFEAETYRKMGRLEKSAVLAEWSAIARART